MRFTPPKTLGSTPGLREPLKVALMELARMRPRLKARLGTVTDMQHRSIRQLLQLEEEQLHVEDCDHARNERLLEHYREIRGRLVTAIEDPEPKDPEVRASAFEENLDAKLAVYLTYVMRVAAEYDDPEKSPHAGSWRSTLTAHGQDLCELVSLAFENVALQEPHYRRNPRATGYFRALGSRGRLS